jgi:hypothetical protein
MIRSTEEKTMKKATAITRVFLDIGGVLLHQRVGSSRPQTGSDELQAGVGRDPSPELSFGASCLRNRNLTPR